MAVANEDPRADGQLPDGSDAAVRREQVHNRPQSRDRSGEDRAQDRRAGRSRYLRCGERPRNAGGHGMKEDRAAEWEEGESSRNSKPIAHVKPLKGFTLPTMNPLDRSVSRIGATKPCANAIVALREDVIKRSGWELHLTATG